MKGKKIFFRVDSGKQTGMGHLIRCISLAVALKNKFEVFFFLNTGSDTESFILEEYQLKWIFVSRNDENDFLSRLNGEEIVVMDGYIFKLEFHVAIKSRGCFLIHIDDLANFHQMADIVINHSANAMQLNYSKAPYTKLLLGPEYVLLRPFFMKEHSVEQDKNVYRHVVITMGGADEHDLTSNFVTFCVSAMLFKQISVVLGPLYSKGLKLKEQYADKINIHEQLNETEIGNLLLSASLIICPASGTLLEALSLHKICLAGYSADNQLTNYQGLTERNVFVPMGNLNDMNEKDFLSMLNAITPEFKQVINKNTKRLFDKKSLQRIVAVIEESFSV